MNVETLVKKTVKEIQEAYQEEHISGAASVIVNNEAARFFWKSVRAELLEKKIISILLIDRLDKVVQKVGRGNI